MTGSPSSGKINAIAFNDNGTFLVSGRDENIET